MYKHNHGGSMGQPFHRHGIALPQRALQGITTHRFIKSQEVKEGISPKHLGQGVRIA